MHLHLALLLIALASWSAGCSSDDAVPPAPEPSDGDQTDGERADDDSTPESLDAASPRRDAMVDASSPPSVRDSSLPRVDAAPVEPPPEGACPGLPAVSDYGATGAFADVKVFPNVGPNNNYTLIRPDGSLGKDGFKHPIAVWGNGISTTPDHYTQTLSLIASHGIVVIACNDTRAERPCLDAGIEWLIAQNDSGPMQGKLDTRNEATIGYSWGGGAAIDTANRPNVRATVSLHGMPPREANAFPDMHSPLLLYTSTGDGFVTAEGYVTPNYEKSEVQTFYATLDDANAGHLYVVDEGSVACLVSVALGACEGAIAERASTVAWLRLWQCGDANARKFFYGDDCTLCKAPWTMPQRKHWN